MPEHTGIPVIGVMRIRYAPREFFFIAEISIGTPPRLRKRSHIRIIPAPPSVCSNLISDSDRNAG
jgi:hypothetical protein